jgi:hypothetical protein
MDQTQWELKENCQNGHKTPAGKPIYVPASLRGYMGCVNNELEIKYEKGQLECGPPKGSYLNSCPAALAKMSYDGGKTPGGNVLVAQCHAGAAPPREYKYSTVNSCGTDISFTGVNGKPNEYQIACNLPQGSYLRSCQSEHVSDPWNYLNGASLLHAECNNRDGQPQKTSLQEPYYCFGSDIANQNGQLVCTGLGHTGGTGNGIPSVQRGVVLDRFTTTGCPGNPYDGCP